MKQHKTRKVLVVLATIVNILLILILISSTVLLVVANGNASRTGTVQIMGYSLYLSDSDAEGLPGNTGVVVAEINDYDFEDNEMLICRMENNYGEFSIVSCRYIRSNQAAETVTVQDPATGKAVKIEQGDVLGRYVFTSSFLGSWIALLQDPGSRSLFLFVVVGGGIILLLLCLFLRMSYSRKNRKVPVNEWEQGSLPEEIDVFGQSGPENPQPLSEKEPLVDDTNTGDATPASPTEQQPTPQNDLPDPVPPVVQQPVAQPVTQSHSLDSVSPTVSPSTTSENNDDDPVSAILSELNTDRPPAVSSKPDDDSVDQIVNWLNANANKSEEK